MNSLIEISPLNFIFFSLLVGILVIFNVLIDKKIKSGNLSGKYLKIYKSINYILILTMCLIAYIFLINPAYNYFSN